MDVILLGGSAELTIAYAASGSAAYEVRVLALLLCADFSSSAPLGSQFGASLSRRSLSSPGGILYQIVLINIYKYIQHGRVIDNIIFRGFSNIIRAANFIL